MRRLASATVVLVAAGAVAANTAADSPVPGWLPCEYTLTVIEPPDLGPGSETLVFNDINDHFVVVGRLGLGSPGEVPILWSEEQGVVILPSPPGYSGCTAWRINNNGWTLSQAGGGPVHSFVSVTQCWDHWCPAVTVTVR